MRLRVILLGGLLVVYGILIVPFAGYMKNRPNAIKLGFMPEAKVLKLTAPDYRQLLAQHAVVRVLFYFGTLLDPSNQTVKSPPEFFHMFTTLQQAVMLDPYNMDAYYFAQAAFTWELRKIKEVNNLLDYGMKYRTWDAQLPFFAAFNCAYFQKNYQAASNYMKIAAERSGNPLFTNLAARYFYEAGQTAIGLAFIEQMEKTAVDPRIKILYRLRMEALRRVHQIESALKKYQQANGSTTIDINQLVRSGYLVDIPEDPYGGHFYLDQDGVVRSTSKFAFTEGRTVGQK